jgi:sugar phosphate isomerase/epimerase
MKLAFSTLVCPAWSLDQIITSASRYNLGIDFRGIGPEIDISKMPEFNEKLDETISLIRASEVALPCFNTSITLIAPSDRWQQMLDECQRYARLAERTGTKFLRIFGGGIPKEMSRDEAIQMGQRRLRQLVKICHGHGCQPILETHDDWTTSEQVLELIHEFQPTEIGVLWDVEHTIRHGESSADTVSRLGRFIVHVHIKDSHRDPAGHNLQQLLGDGDLPIKEAIDALHQNSFDGWYSLETEKRWQPDAPEPEQSLPRFVEFMSLVKMR